MSITAVARRLAVPALVLLAVPACDDDPTSPTALDGSYFSTTFLVRPDGEQQIDVAQAGGSIQITIDPSGNTSGQLLIPPSVTGSSPFVASMAGRVVRTGDIVTFDQDADSFVRDLEFRVDGTRLRAVEQRVGDAVFSVTLSR